jgi:hypothetical protein
MKIKRLDGEHIRLQFLMLIVSMGLFLVLALFSKHIVWIEDFQYFLIFISGIFAVFIGIISILRYITQRKSTLFLFLGIGFLAVGLFETLNLVVDLGNFCLLFSGNSNLIYSLSSVIPRLFLAVLIFLSWILSKRYIEDSELKDRDNSIYILLFFIIFFFSGVTTYVFLGAASKEILLVVILGIVTLLLFLVSFVAYMFRREWLYEDLYFWILYMLALMLLSQIFYMPFLNIQYESMFNISVLIKFFAYLGLLIGFLNSIYEMFKSEVAVQDELEKKSRQIERTKRKIEEGYLIIRKEKWDLAKKKKVVKKKISKK